MPRTTCSLEKQETHNAILVSKEWLPRDYAAKAKSEKVSVLALKVSAFLQSHAALCLARFSFFIQSKPLRPHLLYSITCSIKYQ